MRDNQRPCPRKTSVSGVTIILEQNNLKSNIYTFASAFKVTRYLKLACDSLAEYFDEDTVENTR